MKILVFDTETTGLVNFKLPLDDPTQPRLLQIASVMTNEVTWTPAVVCSMYIKQPGVVIPPAATEVHGITSAYLDELGLPCSYVLHIFMKLFALADQVWAFNADYDCACVGGELLRLDRKDDYAKLGGVFCMMKPLTDVCKLPGNYGKYKWPKLSEAYKHFFNEVPPVAHNALADVHATIKVMRAYYEQFNKLPDV